MIAILPELAGEAQSLVEARLLPPWMRRLLIQLGHRGSQAAQGDPGAT